MNYKNTENKIIDDEILSGDDEKIRALLGGLKRVEAPKDFDFHLKARRARATPSESRAPQFLPVLRYVLPLGLVLFVAALAVLNGVYFTDTKIDEPLAEKRLENPAAENVIDKQKTEITPNPPETARLESKDADQIVAGSVKTAAKGKLAIVNPSVDVAARTSVNSAAKSVSIVNADKDAVRSRTSALTSANQITPPGINPSKTVSTSPNSGGSKSLTVKEVLQQLGIEAVYEGESWTVKSLGQNSLAERSGVKSGDAVEAIDDERLTEKPLKHATIEGKKLTIARGAVKIEISLSGRQN